MIPLIGESKNVLTAGKVVGPIADLSLYRSEKCKRGEPGYVMGRSDLMEFNHCGHRWVNGYKDDDTDSTEWGDLIDCLKLTPSLFKDRYAVQPDSYIDTGMQCPVCKSVTDSASCKKCKTPRVQIDVKKDWNSNSDICAKWEAQQLGKSIVKHKLFGPACDAVKVIDQDAEIKALLDCSQRQVMATASYHDKDTGITVPLKILIDALPAVDSKWGKSLVDLKTTATADMRMWTRSVRKWNLDAQAALYLDVWTANTGEDRCEFRHIVQESYPPYETCRRLLSVEFLELGRMRYREALVNYARALATGIWPTYECRREFDGWQSVEPDENWMQ